jgi:hypothetical protein
MSKGFLVLFFKKELLSFVSTSQIPAYRQAKRKSTIYSYGCIFSRGVADASLVRPVDACRAGTPAG